MATTENGSDLGPKFPTWWSPNSPGGSLLPALFYHSGKPGNGNDHLLWHRCNWELSLIMVQWKNCVMPSHLFGNINCIVCLIVAIVCLFVAWLLALCELP